MTRPTSFRRAALLGACTLAGAALAAEPSLRIDGAAVLPMSWPQQSYFGVGGQGAVTGALELAPALDVEASVSWLLLPTTAAAPISQPGTVLAAAAGLRVKRPLEGAQVVPWLAAHVGYAASGVSSLLLAPSVGLHFRTSETSPLLFGPMVRLNQLFKLGELPSRQSYDASLLALGVAVELAPRDAAKPLDTDGDGVLDVNDACPTVPGVGANGCPLPAPPPPPKDTDGDGLADDVDRCATAPEDQDGFEDEDGCPDPDNDADGVKDVVDECPMVPGAATAGGCPDTDGDTVRDAKDACPKKPGRPEDGGCPVYKEVTVTATKLEIKQKIFFAFGTTRIMPKSHPLLGEVTAALQDREALCVRVEGHTDSVGKADANLKLSAGRAAAVREYLVSQGVAAGRLTAQGYGMTLPMDTNATAEGRENNRRVEFVIVPCEGQKE